jgi:hypothetical protein
MASPPRALLEHMINMRSTATSPATMTYIHTLLHGDAVRVGVKHRDGIPNQALLVDIVGVWSVDVGRYARHGEEARQTNKTIVA